MSLGIAAMRILRSRGKERPCTAKISKANQVLYSSVQVHRSDEFLHFDNLSELFLELNEMVAKCIVPHQVAMPGGLHYHTLGYN